MITSIVVAAGSHEESQVALADQVDVDVSRRRGARHETAVVELLSVGPDLEGDRSSARHLIVDTHIGCEARTRALQSVTDERCTVHAEALLVAPSATADRLAIARHGVSLARISFGR